MRGRVLDLMVALLPALAWCGCAGRDAAAEFEATAAGSIMTKLRERHGGLDRFQRFAGVVFRYRVQFRGRTRCFESVGFRFSDPQRLWMRPTPDAEPLLLTLRESLAPLEARPVTALARAAATSADRVGLSGVRFPPHDGGPSATENLSEPELDLAFRSIPFLLEPTLTTSTTRCSYRTLLAPGRAEARGRIEVEPSSFSSIGGNYLLEGDPHTGLLGQILYRGSHRVIRGRTQLVAFDDYASVQGIMVARRRVHRRPVDVAESRLTRNPFVVPRTRSCETFLIEYLDGIRFLSGEEADDLLPLPLEEDLAASSDGARPAARARAN